MSAGTEEIARADEAAASLFDMIEEFSKELDQIVNSIKKDDGTSRLRDTERGDDRCVMENGNEKVQSDSDDETHENVTYELSEHLNEVKNELNQAPVHQDIYTNPSTQPINISTLPVSSSMTTILFKDLTVDIDSPLVTQSLSAPSTPNYDKHSLNSSPYNEKYSRTNNEDIISPRRLLHDADINEEKMPDANLNVVNSWGISNWMTKAKGFIANQSYPSEKYKKLSKDSGAIEIVISAGEVNKIPFFVPKGKSIMWSTAICQYDINFSVAVRVQEMGGAVEQEVEPVTKLYANHDTVAIGYRKACDIDRYLLYIFDNSYSKLRSKSVLYKIVVGKVADIGIEDYILELEEAEKDKQSLVTNSTSTNTYISRATIADARILFQLSKQVLNTVVNNAQILASDVAIKASAAVKDTVFTKSIDNTRCNIDTASIDDYDSGGEEGQFVHSASRNVTLAPVFNSKTPKHRITIHPNAIIESAQYQDNYAMIADSHSVMVKLLVTPLDNKAVGFPEIQLPTHYNENCIYQVNSTVTSNGVRIYGYAEGFSNQHTSKILCFIESYCFKILQNDDMVVEKGQDLWELHLGFKITQKEYLADFMKHLKLKALLSNLLFLSPSDEALYSQYL